MAHGYGVSLGSDESVSEYTAHLKWVNRTMLYRDSYLSKAVRGGSMLSKMSKFCIRTGWIFLIFPFASICTVVWHGDVI